MSLLKPRALIGTTLDAPLPTRLQQRAFLAQSASTASASGSPGPWRAVCRTRSTASAGAGDGAGGILARANAEQADLGGQFARRVLRDVSCRTAWLARGVDQSGGGAVSLAGAAAGAAAQLLHRRNL